MDPDAAELSSITTSVADLAERIGGVAQRRSGDQDDPMITRLYEAERALLTAERRLRTIGRSLQ